MKELEFFKLEDRVLFEAAAAVEIADAVEEAQQDPNADISESERQEQEERDTVKNAPPENPAAAMEAPVNDDPSEIADADAEIDALIGGEIPAGMESALIDDNGEVISTGKELVVINNSVADKDMIISGMKPNQDVLILEDGNGLDELNEFLDECGTEYSAIHLVTHGNDGYISVNGEIIDAENFDAEAWQQIGEHLTEDGDILLYGCDTAANAEGMELVNMIADASGADVAASDDATGISGDWDLEFTAGVIEADEIVVENFEHNLNNFTVTNLNDSGAGSLRQAILDANYDTGTDEITITANGVIKLDSVIEITESVNITVFGANDTIIDGQDNNGIFAYDGSGDFALALSNMTLQNGSADDGGAVYISSSGGDISLSLDGVVIKNSVATDNSYGGGAIAMINSDSSGGSISLDITESKFVDNSSAASGGAIYVNAFGGVDLEITKTLFSGNEVTDPTAGGSGGAIHVTAASFSGDTVNLDLDQVTITGSKATDGGAVYVSGKNMDVAVTLHNSTLFDNHAENGSGGALYVNADTFDINVINSTLTGNSDYHDGGYSGGAIFAKAGEDSSMNIVNSIVYGNYNVDGSGNFNAGSDIYSLTEGAGITLDNNVINSIYGVAVEGTDPVNMDLLADADIINSKQFDYSDANMQTVFGTADPALNADNVIQVNNKGFAGYGGTLVAQDSSGNFSYMAADGSWKYFDGNPVSTTPPDADIISTDQAGNERDFAQEVLGVKEFFVGAAAGKVYVEVVAEKEHSYTYDGNTKKLDLTYKTASGAEITNSALTTNEAVITSGKNAGTYTFAHADIQSNTAVTIPSTSSAVAEDFEIAVVSSEAGDSSGKSTITIDPKPLSITFDASQANKVYDGTTAVKNTINVTITGIVGTDEVSTSGNWAYDDANAGTNKDVIYSDITLAGADSGNYTLDGVTSVTVAGGIISPADVNVIYVTQEPYFYDSTDQSDTVSAYYVDINGVRHDLTIDWGGKIFAAVGDYKITVTITDPNYNAVNDSYTLTMHSSNPGGDYSDDEDNSAGDYSDGVSNPKYSGTIPAMQGNMSANGIGGGIYGNTYTMSYAELVSHTMFSGIDDLAVSLFPVEGMVKLDVLEYKPMTIDRIASENIAVESAWVINQAGMISGEELFSTRNDALIEVRGDAPVESPEVLYVDGVSEAEVLPWSVVPDPVLTASRIFDRSVQNIVPENYDLPVVNLIPEKAEAFKSDFEKLLEEIVLA